VVPHRPPVQVMFPRFTGAVVCGGHVGQLVVQGNVTSHDDEDGANKIKERTAQKEVVREMTPACQGEPTHNNISCCKKKKWTVTSVRLASGLCEKISDFSKRDNGAENELK